MVDVDTFLTTLSVMIDDGCKASWPADAPPGPQAARSRSAVLTLALCGQWQACGRARGLYRCAQRHVRAAFPRLPARTQLNRPRRHPQPARVLCVLQLVQLFATHQWLYEALDSAGVPTREAKRRGRGWLPGLAKIGWSNRRGWSEGLPRLRAVSPVGGITGLGVGPARTPDQRRADTLCALRRSPPPP